MIKKVDALIIGGGPSGLAAALSLKKSGIDDILVVERENCPGGILQQCIHNGFGLHEFKEELTGPEYAERFINAVAEQQIDVWINTCAIDIISEKDESKKVILLSAEHGVVTVETKAVILSMGCRERNRGNIAIPGSRPAGIMTAGLAQKMVNKYGYLPGKEVVILGSGDIGLIMARRMTWEGARVKAVVEVQSYPGGLNRNIVQCLDDFKIPLYLSHAVTRIYGGKRISSVDIAPVNEYFEPAPKDTFNLTCDTLLLSVGLVPENELSLKAGVKLDPVTRGPLVNSFLMTNIPGIFACGNVLQVHDLVDFVSEESAYCGKMAAEYLKNGYREQKEIEVISGNMVRYVLPTKIYSGQEAVLSLRPIAPAEKQTLEVKADGKTIYRKSYRKIFPSIMERFTIKDVPADTQRLEVGFVARGKGKL
jgi:NADPH-dependent 2,4-dienoyl-CoA reductase/sulfur reductase-like enzyme